MDVTGIGVQRFDGGYDMPIEQPVGHTAPAPAAPQKNGNGMTERPVVESGQGGFKPENLDSRYVDDIMTRSVEEINRKLGFVSREMEYSFHRPTRSVSVTVFDSETREVIREIPPQSALDAIARMWELTGILVDEKR